MSEAIKFPDKGSMNTYIWLPLTMTQFQDLTNEMLKLTNDQVAATEVLAGRDPAGLGFNADYYAQILMSAIHSADVKGGKVLKSQLYEGCWNRISKHVTYHVVEEIQARLKAAQPAAPAAEPLPDEVTNKVAAPVGPVA